MMPEIGPVFGKDHASPIGSCAQGCLYISFTDLPERRRMHPKIPVQRDRPVHRARGFRLVTPKTCDSSSWRADLFFSATPLLPQDPRMREMKLQDLKSKSPTELLAFAEEHEVENASTMRKQELMFAILKQLASKEIEIIGEG